MNKSRKNKKGGHKDRKPRVRGQHTDAGREDRDQEGHREELPYNIELSAILGRYLVGARDLQPGEVIMSEDPLVVGPCQGCKPMCLGCYKLLVSDMENMARCCKCGWPMCGPDCQGLNTEFGHSMQECAILASCEVDRHLTQDLKAQYSAIVPLRCLLLKHHKPDKWKVLCTMESHNEVRRNLPNIWQNNQSSVVDRIRELWGVRQYSEEEIHTVCGVLEVNAFEVGQHGVSVRALYPTAFYLAHSCVPNTSHTDDDNYRLTVRCSSQIKKGDTITLSYAYTLQGTLKRREHLKESKFFDCCCPRCKDPTELATYAGALKCPKCDVGYVISSEPLERAASWRCSQCSNYTVTAHSVMLLLEKIADEVEALDANDIEAMEGFLLKYRNVLHPNHYHCLGVKHSLSQLYGKIQGYMINELPDKLLHRKRDVCRELLRVINVLEPGYSRLRGIVPR